MSRRNSVFQDGNIGLPLNYDIAARSAMQDKDIKAQKEMQDASLRQRNAQQQRTASQEAIDKIKDFDHIGNSTVDIATDNAITGVRQKANSMLGEGASPNEVNAYIQREIPVIANGHTIAKNYSDQMKAQSIELAKIYGGDPQKLYQQSMQKAVPDWITADESGQLKYKPMIDPNKNYLAEMESLDNLPSWVPQSEGLIEHVSKLPKDETTSNTVVRDKGFAHIDKQTEETNAFYEPTFDAKGQLTGKKVKVDESGALPEQQFQIFVADPKARAQFAREYAPIKKAQQEAFDKQGLGKMSPEADNLLQRQVAAKLVESGISGLKSKSEVQDITPKPTVIKNYNGSGGKSGSDVPTIRVFADIEKLVDDNDVDVLRKDKDGNQEYVVGTPTNSLREAAQKRVVAAAQVRDPDVEPKNLMLRRGEDGKIWVLDKSKVPTEVNIIGGKLQKIDIPKEAWLIPLTEEDVDLGATAPLGTKSKQEVARTTGGAAPQPKPAKSGAIRFVGPDGKTYEGTQETIDKMKKAGVKYTIKN